MDQLAPSAVTWVEGVLGARVEQIRGLRDGGMPWRLEAGGRAVVLRTGTTSDPETMRVERLGVEIAAGAGIPVSAVIAADPDHDPPLLLVAAVAGDSTIPRELPSARLRTLGSVAAALHRIVVPPGAGLPQRDRPIAGVDFDALRGAAPARPLLVQAEQVRRDVRPSGPGGFVHGDLWQGNALWSGDRLVALIDWDCAGVGPAGVDLGSLRCDAAVCFGLEAAAEVLAGWETGAGRPADDVAYWDVVAALSTPPDMGWFVGTIRSQGRPDLTHECLLHRRDEFLSAALDRV